MKINRPRRAVALAACTMTAVAGFSALGNLQAGAAAPATPLDIVLGVGADPSAKVVSWYVHSTKQQLLQISPGTALSATPKTLVAESAVNTTVDTTPFAGKSKEFAGDSTRPPMVQTAGEWSNAHVDLSDLEPATQYTYRVGVEGAWSAPYTFSTGSADKNAFTFAAFGDPQIGSSGYAHNDGRGWAKTLDHIKANAPQTELLVSTGDQVENANDEDHWFNWADPDDSAKGDGSSISTVLKEFTYAPQIGNHEGAWSEVQSPTSATPTSAGRAYNQHFFPPNNVQSSSFIRTAALNGSGAVVPDGTLDTRPGGDYWYVYKNTLFININSNAYTTQAGVNADAEHAKFITDVVKKHGAGTTWQIVTFHHSIYSPADHANDGDNYQRRKDLTYTMSQQGIDLVIQGHDHAYSRSYELKSSTPGVAASKAKSNEQPGADAVQTGPGGVVYITVDSSSGSKYYDLTIPNTALYVGPKPAGAPADNGYGPDVKFPSVKNDQNQARHVVNSVESQQYVPTYVQVQVSKNKLSVKNIATATYTDPANSAYRTGTVKAKADLGDQRVPLPAPARGNVHWLQTPGALADEFVLRGGNTRAQSRQADQDDQGEDD